MSSYTLDVRSHAFNVGIAKDYSPSMSLWLGHLSFWAEKNLANSKHIHDGHVWCFDTLDAICEYFPYFTRRQIETMINNSVDAGLVIKGNYNQTQYDRTCWYALTPKAFDYFPHLSNQKYIEKLYSSISQKCEMDLTEWGNRFTHFVMTIPDTDPDTDPTTTTTDNQPTDKPQINESESPCSSIFSEKTDKELISLRNKNIPTDKRSNEEFLNQCKHHIDKGSKEHSYPQRMAGLKKIIQGGHFETPAGYKVKQATKKQEAIQEYQIYVSQLKTDIEFGLKPENSIILSFEEWKLKHE